MSEIGMCDAVKIYDDGHRDGEKAVLRLLQMILDEGNKSHNYTHMYYKASLELVLELFNYGKEEKEN